MTRTPALTLWRPWTACITDLPEQWAKRIENRGWKTAYRGDLWLHAGRRFDDGALTFAEKIAGDGLLARSTHPVGVVALIELVEVCAVGLATFGSFNDCDCGPWAVPGEAHWRIANVRKLAEPVPCRGSQQLWALPPDVERACREQIDASAT